MSEDLEVCVCGSRGLIGNGMRVIIEGTCWGEVLRRGGRGTYTAASGIRGGGIGD